MIHATPCQKKKKKKAKNEQRYKYVIPQRKQRYGQKAHEKMLNITTYQKNSHQMYNEVSPHTSQNGHH